MNWDEMIAVVGDVRYKEGWRFLVTMDGPRPILQVEFTAPCPVTCHRVTQRGRKWLLSPHMTRGELVGTCLKAVLTAEEHEAREIFRYRGRAVFGPHIDIDVLHEACEAVLVRGASASG